MCFLSGRAIAHLPSGAQDFDLSFGVPQDDAQAMEWWHRSAARNAGVENLFGWGALPEDDVRAVARLRKAADEGQASAQFLLGTMYADGRGVPQDDELAIVWWSKAAAKGDAGAQTNLGISYFNGLGMPQDQQKGCDLLREAGEQGFAPAVGIYGRLCNP